MQLPQFLSGLAANVSDTPAGQIETMKDELTSELGALSTSDKPIIKKAHKIVTSVWVRLLLALAFPFLVNYLNNYLYPGKARKEQDPYDAQHASDDEEDYDDEEDWDDEEDYEDERAR